MFTTQLVIQMSFAFSSNQITIVLFNFKPSYFILGAYFAPASEAAKSVFPKLAISDIICWLYYYTEHGM